MEEEAEENTMFLSMKRNFDAMLAGSAARKSQRKSLARSYKFQEGSFSGADDVMDSLDHVCESVSMQQVLEKEKEGHKLRTELARAKNRVAELENDMAQVEMTRKRARVEWDQELNKQKSQFMRAEDQVCSLRQKLSSMERNESSLRHEIKELRVSQEAAKHCLEQRLHETLSDKIKMSAEFQSTEQSLQKQILELRNEKMHNQTAIQVCQSELQHCRDQLNSAQKRCTTLSNLLQEGEEMKLTCQDSQQRIKDLEHQLERVKEDNKIGLALKDKVKHFQEMESEHRKYKEENAFHRETLENVVLLREEAESLRAKLERSESRNHGMTDLQLKCQELEQKITENESGCDNKMKQSEVSRHVADLQSSHAMLVERQGQLQASTHLAQHTAQATEKRLRAIQLQLTQSQNEHQQLTEKCERLQRKLVLVTKERDSYHKLASSSPGGSTVASQTSMEPLLKGYRAEIDRLEANIQRLVSQKGLADQKIAVMHESNKGRDSFPPSSTGTDSKLILTLRQQIEETEKRLSKSEEARDILETRLERHNLQGDYDPTTTKVIHFKMNPADMAQKRHRQEVTDLQSENDRLKERVKLLEERKAEELSDITMQVEEKLKEPSTSKHIEEIKAQLTSQELKNKRLMEVFKKTSQEFREVSYQLLGYRIDMADISNAAQYKLLNMYSESPEDVLVFKKTKDGELQMLSNEFSESLEDKVEHYLQASNSIPAFLSAVTLDLFSRQTMMQ